MIEKRIETKSKMAATQTTEFMGSNRDSEIVTRALNASAVKKLTVQQFVKETQFEIDQHMFDHFWQVVAQNQRPHVGALVLNWLGYEGELRKQREKFIAYLKRNNIAFEEIDREDDRVELYPSIQEELCLLGANNVARAKFLIMASRDFKKAIMKLSTKRSDDIREYYLRVEELLQLYVEYDKRFEMRKRDEELNRRGDKIDKLEEMMKRMGIKIDDLLDKNDDLLDKNDELLLKNDELNQNVGKLDTRVKTVQRRLDIAVEDRAPQPQRVEARERFILLRRNDDDYPYYTIRAQHRNAQVALSKQEKLYSEMRVLLDIDCQPNSKTLYVRIKDQLRQRGVEFRFCRISLADSNVTERDLIDAMRAVNNEKLQIE